MYNELIFFLHAILIGIFALGALRFGKEALVAFISLAIVLANLFVLKETTLFGLTATCSDAFAIGAVLGLNLLQEYFGKDLAKKAIWISFFLLLFYCIVSQVHLIYIPNLHDSMQSHYAAILGFMPRIIIASLISYLISQNVDAWLFGRLKILFSGKYLVVRNILSLSISQFIDTVLFSFLGLFGIVSNVWHIIFISYIIKLCAIAATSPFIALSKKVIK